MDTGRIGRQFHCPTVARDRLVVLSLPLEHARQIAMRTGPVRAQGQRRTKRHDGIVQPPQRLQRCTKVVVSIREWRIQRDGLSIASGGIVNRPRGEIRGCNESPRDWGAPSAVASCGTAAGTPCFLSARPRLAELPEVRSQPGGTLIQVYGDSRFRRERSMLASLKHASLLSERSPTGRIHVGPRRGRLNVQYEPCASACSTFGVGMTFLRRHRLVSSPTLVVSSALRPPADRLAGDADGSREPRIGDDNGEVIRCVSGSTLPLPSVVLPGERDTEWNRTWRSNCASPARRPSLLLRGAIGAIQRIAAR